MAKRPRVLRNHELSTMHPREVFGRHIKLIRTALNMSVIEFAATVGVSPGTVSNIENAGSPNAQTIDRIMSALRGIKGLQVIPNDGRSFGVKIDCRKILRRGAKWKTKPIPSREFYGHYIKLARVALNMSVAQFAEFVGVAYNTISNIENAGSPNIDTVDGIAVALGGIGDVLKLFRDGGNSIGVRLNYEELRGTILGVTPKLREFKKVPEWQPPIDPDWITKGSIQYPQELADKDDAELKRQYELAQETRRDKRVGKRKQAGTTTTKNTGGKPKPPQGVPL